jgi:hypothetical protein
MNAGVAPVPAAVTAPVTVAAAPAAGQEDPSAAHAAANANAPDWSDSADNSNSQEDEFLPPPQGPSLSYERKIRLHKYAENRARSCLGLLADSSNALWKVHECKNDIGVYKPSSDWSESVSAKAVVFANAAFPNVLKAIYDLKTSDKFKLFMRKVLGDMFLDAEVLEDLNGTGVYPSANPPRDGREMFKQAAIKWWAIKSGTLASKSSDFYVLEVRRVSCLQRHDGCVSSIFPVVTRHADDQSCPTDDVSLSLIDSTLASRRPAATSWRATSSRSRWRRWAACRTSKATTWSALSSTH